MKIEAVILNGKRRILVSVTASGEDKTKEAALVVMGPGYKYKDDNLKGTD